MKIIDISQSLLSCNVYPGDKAPCTKQVKNIQEHKYNLTEISMSVHSGTHVDTPLHFIENGDDIDSFSLEIFYGKCLVTKWLENIPKSCERLLIKGDYVITAEDAKEIVKSDVKLIGVESQSVGPAKTPMEVHKILLGDGIVLLEGLVLGHVKTGEYILSAMPLSITNCDGAPVRAVLIKN